MKKKAKQKKLAKPIPPKEKEGPQEEEKPFDFGGIPDRDLKKNLGCG
jgi:hypothetical protein